MKLAVIVVNNISDSKVKNPVVIGTSIESTQAWTSFGIEGNKYFLHSGEEVDDKKMKRRIERMIHRCEDYKETGQIIGTIHLKNDEILEIQVRNIH